MAFRLVGCSGDWRPSSIIRRTPYSALEEKIICGYPTTAVGYTFRPRGRAVRPVGWRLMSGPSLATSAEIADMAATARARGRLGIDTEFMSEGRYRALLCLTQVVVDGDGGEPQIIVIDGLDAADVTPLAQALA